MKPVFIVILVLAALSRCNLLIACILYYNGFRIQLFNLIKEFLNGKTTIPAKDDHAAFPAKDNNMVFPAKSSYFVQIQHVSISGCAAD